MKNLDIVILSNTINIDYYNILSSCINTITQSNNDVKSNIIVVETNTKLKEKEIPLPIDEIIFPGEPFNYNKFLNYGLEKTKADHILISNNDILYKENCLSKLLLALKIYDSVSPADLNNTRHHNMHRTTEGTEVGKHVTGYSICINRKVLDIIGKFDEQFTFWYQDNDYCNLLKRHNLRHALVGEAKCFHQGGASHR